MMIGIVAIAKNMAIGKGGRLPWHYSADLRFFKETTSGAAVVMGSKTWQSIGKALPNRLNIVLTHSADVELPEGVEKFGSADQVLEFSRSYTGDVFIIGGAKVFTAFADAIEKWLVTEIPLEIDNADTFMPSNFLDGFVDTGAKDLGEGLVVKILQRK